MDIGIRLHSAFVAAIEDIRAKFADADIGRFEFRVVSSGRTMTDEAEVKIEYVCCANYEADVHGNCLENVVEEVLRRHGWDDRNAPLALPHAR
jgi:hypothetical protein